MLSVNFNAFKMSSARELFKLKRLRDKMLNCEAFLIKIHFKRKLIDETKFEKCQNMITKILSRISLVKGSIDKMGKSSILTEIELIKEVVNHLMGELKSFKAVYLAASSETRSSHQTSKKRGTQESKIRLDITNWDASQCDSTESSCKKTDDFKTTFVTPKTAKDKVSIYHSITPIGDETPEDGLDFYCLSEEKMGDITTPMGTLQIAKEGFQDCPVSTFESTAKLETRSQVRARINQPSDRWRKQFLGKVEKTNKILLELRKTAEKRLYADRAIKESEFEEILESVANISLRTARIESELHSETKNWICNQFALATEEISEIKSQFKN